MPFLIVLSIIPLVFVISSFGGIFRTREVLVDR